VLGTLVDELEVVFVVDPLDLLLDPLDELVVLEPLSDVDVVVVGIVK